MINAFADLIECLLAGVGTGIYAFVKVLPIYEQLSGLKDEIISAVTGIPVIVLTIIGLIPLTIKIYRFVVERIDA